ncbi:MAG: hypothetical protein LBQ31_03065 [Bacteroidales bacterium]|nr:hypothetical protein [Bacteroidales bacterium]
MGIPTPLAELRGGVGLSAAIFLPIPLVFYDPPTYAKPTTTRKTTC